MFVEPYTKKQKLRRLLFRVVWVIFARPFPQATMKSWNIFLLRLFGAKISNKAVVYSSTNVYMPENLVMDDFACLAGHTIVENAAVVHLEEGAIVSQYSYLCTASHDIRDDDFPQFSKPITIGKKAWVTAGCFVGPGVTVEEGAVVGARSAVFKDVKANTVVGGNPAKYIKNRYE